MLSYLHVLTDELYLYTYETETLHIYWSTSFLEDTAPAKINK